MEFLLVYDWYFLLERRRFSKTFTLYDVTTKSPLISRKVANSQNKKGGEQGVIEFLLRKYHRLHPKKRLIISIDAIGANQYITKLCNELGYGFVINIKREEHDGLGGIIKDDFLVEFNDEKHSDRLTKRLSKIQRKRLATGKLLTLCYLLMNQ